MPQNQVAELRSILLTHKVLCMNKIAILRQASLIRLVGVAAQSIQHKTNLLRAEATAEPERTRTPPGKNPGYGQPVFGAGRPGSYRGVLAKVPRATAPSVVILHVDSHDDAYAWARRHRAGVNPDSGTFEVMRFNPQPVAAAAEPQGTCYC